jgi:hypothetical protein
VKSQWQIILISILASTSMAETIIHPGNVSGIWTTEGSPYIIAAHQVIIPAGQTLTINPGVEVIFTRDCYFRVQGLLLANGSQTDSIVFRRLRPDVWCDIKFEYSSEINNISYAKIFTGYIEVASLNSDSGHTKLEHCTISSAVYGYEDARLFFSDCFFDGGRLYFDHVDTTAALYCTFRNSSVPIESYYGHALIYGCDIGYSNSWGVMLHPGSPVIRRCLIHHNGGRGINTSSGATPEIDECIIYGNTGGVFFYDAGSSLTHSIIAYNLQPLTGVGNAIVCVQSYPLISNNFILGQEASYGGGLWTEAPGSPDPYHCVFANNSAIQGGGLFLDASCDLTNCTVASNHAVNHGGGLDLHLGDMNLKNMIVYDNSGGGLYTGWGQGLQVANSAFCNNQGSNFSGFNLNPQLGLINQTNTNGDSCDTYGNLFLDPMFVDPQHYDYRLLWGSPCIDSGHPDSLDPDGTRSDMGAFYFDQSVPVHVLLTPHQIPYLIPATGGSMDFTLRLYNWSNASHTVSAWCNVTLPDSSIYGPLLGPVTVTIPASTMIARVRTQTIPASAPLGVYHYNAYAVVAGDTSQDSFMFGKLGAGGLGIGAGGWTNTGDDFDEVEKPLITHNSALITSLHPNPFNLSTTLSFKLQAANHVTLKVYDTAGRLVTTLVDGWREAGDHEVTFDGSGLSSGLYFVRMQAGKFAAVQKMMLLK